MTYSSEVLADSPNGYWRLGESGSTFSDSSGNGQHGVLTGSYTREVTGLVAGDADKATRFTPNSQGVVTGGTEPNPAQTTIEFLCEGTGGNPVDRDDGTNRVYQFQFVPTPVWVFWTAAGGPFFLTSSRFLSPGGRWHIAGTYDGTTARLIIDGIVVASLAQTGAMRSSALRTMIGRGVAAAYFSGVVDEVATYPTALSLTRIQARVALADLTGYMYDGSSQVNTSNTITMGFDGNSATQWLAATSTGWLRFALPTARALTSYTVRGHSNDPSFQAKNWTFEGSNDGTTWTVLDTVINKTWSTSTAAHTVTLSSPGSFQQYRVNVTANAGGSFVGFSEFSWVEAPILPPGVTVAAPVLALAVDVKDPTVDVAVPGVAVTAPVLALALDVLDPTVSAVTPLSVAAPVLALSLDVLDPTVSGAAVVDVAAPALSLALDVLDPFVVVPAPPALELDVGVDLLVLSQESQAAIVEDDGLVLLDAGLDIIVRHQLVPATPPPGAALEWPVRRAAHLMPALTAESPRYEPGDYDLQQSDVGRFHTFVDGHDVTWVRDAPVRFNNVTSGVQVGPLSASVSVPQMRPWDVPGEGDLSMFDPDNDARVEVLFVREDGTTSYPFEGALAQDEDNSGPGREDYTFSAEGALMQANHELYDPPIFQQPADPGWLIADVLNSVTHRRYGKIPRFTTGLPKVTDRGDQGQSKWQRAQALLAKAVDDDGRQLALVRVGPWEYRLAWKQGTTTADFTVTKGAPGVEVSLRVDQSTRRDCIYGRGVDPDGGVWGNWFFPGLDFYLAPAYPMTNSALNLDGRSDSGTDSGNGITLWQRRMRELGYRVTVDGVMNANDVQWIKQVQRARGITADGSLGPQTWSATFDKGATELNFDVVRRPLATTDAVEPYLFQANGAKAGKNPGDNPKKIRHAMPEVDFGENIWKRDAAVLAEKWLARDNVPAHVGTITLTSDPHEAGTSRFDIRPGDNVKVVGHRGDVIVQVAEVSHDDVTVNLTVDSRARDLLALEAILDRDRDARRDAAARTGRTTDMSSLNKSEVVQYESESRAGHYPRTAINGGLWTVLPIFVSQVGVAKIEFVADAPATEFVVALFQKPITANRIASFTANPLSSKDSWYEHKDELTDKHGLMEVFGTPESPGGYSPWQKGEHALTGKLEDSSGAVYGSKYGGYIWVAVFTGASSWVSGRMYPASGR